MIDCPRCAQPILEQAIACPHCGTTLKAFGHPGVTLHRSRGDEYLCQTCIYDTDDTCTYPQRPYARECTLYTTPANLENWTTSPSTGRATGLGLWLKRHTVQLIVLGLIAVSLILALTGREPPADLTPGNPEPGATHTEASDRPRM